MIWSKKSLNPETLYNHEDGTIKGELGCYVMTIEECDECLEERRKEYKTYYTTNGIRK